MKRHLFIALSLIIASIGFGCKSKPTDTKPLAGLVIQRIELTGDQPRTVTDAITSVLVANGAKIATQPNTPGAVVLKGSSQVILVMAWGKSGPGELSVSVESDDGKLAATTYVSDTSVIADKDAVTKLARESGREITKEFAKSYTPPKQKI